MGLFGKSKKELLNWQKIILENSPEKLIMNENQLKQASNLQAQNDLRIINDCIKILSETINPDVFFSRLDLLEEKAQALTKLEPYIKFSGTKPSEAYKQISTDKQDSIKQFLIRYFTSVLDKADTLKTDKGKRNQYQKFYDSLQAYYKYMDSENIDYIETKYKAYTKYLE